MINDQGDPTLALICPGIFISCYTDLRTTLSRNNIKHAYYSRVFYSELNLGC